jgi:hypothetical protein
MVSLNEYVSNLIYFLARSFRQENNSEWAKKVSNKINTNAARRSSRLVGSIFFFEEGIGDTVWCDLFMVVGSPCFHNNYISLLKLKCFHSHHSTQLFEDD